MSVRSVKIQGNILCFMLLLLVAACGSSKEEEIPSTATTMVDQVALDVATATISPPASTDEPIVEPTEIPATSTPVSVAAAKKGNSSNEVDSEPSSAVERTAEGNAAGKSAQQVEADSEQNQGVMPQRIQIPAINLDTPVVELSWHAAQSEDGQIFSEWDVADQAAGWHQNSSLIGEKGNVVLSGHNNILGAVFRELDQLKRGDEALVSTDDGVHRYLVDKVMIVPEKYATQEQRESNAAWIGHFEDDRLTLVSCWPRDDNSHRIIVVAYSEEVAVQ